MAKWISKHEPLILRLTVYGLSFLILPATFWGGPFFAILLAPTTYGLFRMMSWARWTAVAMLWWLGFLLVVGAIFPFLAPNIMPADWVQPPVTKLLIINVPAVAGILWCLHVLGKHKACFR